MESLPCPKHCAGCSRQRVGPPRGRSACGPCVLRLLCVCSCAVYRLLSLLPLIEMLLLTSELLKISLRVIPTPQIFLSSSASMHDFKISFHSLLQLKSLDQKHKPNPHCAIGAVTKPGPSPHFLLPTLTPIALCAAMQVQPHRSLKGCRQAVGWPRHLLAGHSSVEAKHGSSKPKRRGSLVSVQTSRPHRPPGVSPHALLPTLRGPFLGLLMHLF